MEWVIAASFLLSSFLFFTAILSRLFLSDKRLERRLKQYLAVSDRSRLDRKTFQWLWQLQWTKQNIRKKLLTKEKNAKLETMLKRAGLPLKPEEYVLFQWIMTALCGSLFLLFFGQFAFLVIGCTIGWMMPRWYVQKKQKARIIKFNESLPDVLTTMIGSLRAGFSFPQSLQVVIEEASSPMKEEMEAVLREMQYGGSLEEALNHLKERVPSNDLELMIQAIVIQRQVGGNLATVLEKIVQTIRDRTKIQRQVLTLTAQGRLSGMVIGLLPAILAMIIYWIEPNYMKTLFSHPIGLMMLTGGGIASAIGFIIIRKLTAIEV